MDSRISLPPHSRHGRTAANQNGRTIHGQLVMLVPFTASCMFSSFSATSRQTLAMHCSDLVHAAFVNVASAQQQQRRGEQMHARACSDCGLGDVLQLCHLWQHLLQQRMWQHASGRARIITGMHGGMGHAKRPQIPYTMRKGFRGLPPAYCTMRPCSICTVQHDESCHATPACSRRGQASERPCI